MPESVDRKKTVPREYHPILNPTAKRSTQCLTGCLMWMAFMGLIAGFLYLVRPG